MIVYLFNHLRYISIHSFFHIREGRLYFLTFVRLSVKSMYENEIDFVEILLIGRGIWQRKQLVILSKIAAVIQITIWMHLYLSDFWSGNVWLLSY